MTTERERSAGVFQYVGLSVSAGRGAPATWGVGESEIVVKMLTKCPTEQDIWCVLVCHLERQKGLRSSEREFYVAGQ